MGLPSIRKCTARMPGEAAGEGADYAVNRVDLAHRAPGSNLNSLLPKST